jgi:hypothetical protein
MKIKYYTKTLGVNPSFSKEKFYDSYILKVFSLNNELNPRLVLKSQLYVFFK